jgi:hypothetical protein
MRFALLSDHPDGVDMARALVASGRHELAVYCGPSVGQDALRRLGIRVQAVFDMEEVLADPQIEAVIVAGRPADRPVQLRRSLQSERHVLCVYPADQTPDLAHEAAMIQRDTRCVLLPLLPQTLHPGVQLLAELARKEDGPLGDIRLVEMELSARDAVLLDTDTPGQKPSFLGWDILEALGGEIAEISAYAAYEELTADDSLLVAGRFERGGLFQASFLPGRHEDRWRLAAVGSSDRAVLLFPQGCPGPAHLSWEDATGELHEESWEALDPWPALVGVFESALLACPRQAVAAGPLASTIQPEIGGQPSWPEKGGARPALSWQTAVRCQELNDAARRSVNRRRVSTLEYPEASEAVGFKGTMTMIGCGLLWGILLLLILSVWFPQLGWAIVPVLIFFLGLQLLRWLVPAPRQEDHSPGRN